MKIKYLYLFYIIAILLVIIQGFSHTYTDEGVYISVGHFIDNGMKPYIDFIEHHNLFYYMFYIPIFKLFDFPLSLIVIRIISIIFVFISAYLIREIVKKYRLGNPDYATLFFLFGYTGLPINFLRNEFFAMFVILLYFYFDSYFLKGLFIALFGSTSVIFIFPSIFIFIYDIIKNKKNKKNLISYFFGSSIIILLFLIFALFIGINNLFWHLFTLNKEIAYQFNIVFREVIFFSLFLAIPYFVVATSWIIKNYKKDLSKKVILITIGFFTAILISSIMTQGIQKMKLPSYMPLLAIYSIFGGTIRKKSLNLLIFIYLFLITIFVFTPTTYGIIYLKNMYLFDSCVSKEAKIGYNIESKPLYLVRTPDSYEWFLERHMKSLEKNNSIVFCGIAIKEKDIICNNDKLSQINKFCEKNQKTNFIYELKNFLKKRGINLSLV
ncbi:MAG: hypothetical protein QXE31_01105 [Candidatus Woesearchaeota archaeon]